MIRVWISNLGWSFLPSKVPSDTPFLSPWCTNLTEIWYTFNLTQVTKRVKIFAKLIHQGLRYGVSDGTFEAKKDQPKLDIRTMHMMVSSFKCHTFFCRVTKPSSTRFPKLVMQHTLFPSSRPYLNFYDDKASKQNHINILFEPSLHLASEN